MTPRSHIISLALFLTLFHISRCQFVRYSSPVEGGYTSGCSLSDVARDNEVCYIFANTRWYSNGVRGGEHTDRLYNAVPDGQQVSVLSKLDRFDVFGNLKDQSQFGVPAATEMECILLFRFYDPTIDYCLIRYKLSTGELNFGDLEPNAKMAFGKIIEHGRKDLGQ